VRLPRSMSRAFPLCMCPALCLECCISMVTGTGSVCQENRWKYKRSPVISRASFALIRNFRQFLFVDPHRRHFANPAHMPKFCFSPPFAPDCVPESKLFTIHKRHAEFGNRGAILATITNSGKYHSHHSPHTSTKS